jgi:CRP-like cAMP-binding protein
MGRNPNHLLASLSPADWRRLEPHVDKVPLPARKILEQPNRRIEAVYFPLSGFASVVAIQSPTQRVEIGLIGREGMTGLPIVLGNHRSPLAALIQVAGEAQRIPAADLRSAIQQSPSLRDSLLKYAQAFGVQTAQTAISHAICQIDRRLARWLLMAHDRITGDVLPLTQEILSIMLAVRRPSVTLALHSLQRQNFISCGRGTVTVQDRKGLERYVGKFYGIPEAEYRRLIG